MTRRGAGGAVVIAGRGLIGAAFRHRTSRAGDPQLHTHVLVANLVLGADGRWGTLDGRRIYAHAKTAGYLYEPRLRALLTRELGFEWGPVRNGIADVDGVPPAVRRAFSRRRAEIEAEMARRGATSAGAAQVAALATRRAKDYGVAPERLVPEWRERAAALGLDAAAVRALVGRARPRRLDGGEVDARAATARRAGRADGGAVDVHAARRAAGARRASCRPAPTSGSRELERLADRFLGSERVVVLADGERRGEVVGVDGRVVGRARDGAAVLDARAARARAAGARLRATTRRARGCGVGRESAVERALRRRPTIADEQATMVRRLVLDGDGVAVVVGQAGTGKTFALAAAREAWEGSGYRVRRRGAGAAGGDRARGRRRDREHEHRGVARGAPAAAVAALPRRSVLVIDEAGMVPTRALAEIVDHVERCRGEARPGRRRSAAAGDRGRRDVRRARAAAARDRAAREPAAESPCGSARRSRCCATATPRARCGGTPRAGGSSRARTATRCGGDSSPTGGRPAIPTAR